MCGQGRVSAPSGWPSCNRSSISYFSGVDFSSLTPRQHFTVSDSISRQYSTGLCTLIDTLVAFCTCWWDERCYSHKGSAEWEEQKTGCSYALFQDIYCNPAAIFVAKINILLLLFCCLWSSWLVKNTCVGVHGL